MTTGGTFDNKITGQIIIESTGTDGINNWNGTFDNRGSITIGSLSAGPGSAGIQNKATFNNTPSGVIDIDNTASSGISNLAGTFNNEADITIGSAIAVGGNGLTNSSTFNNNAGTVYIKSTDGPLDDGLNNSGTFSNYAALTIGSSGYIVGEGLRNSGTFNHYSNTLVINNTNNSGLFNSSIGDFNNFSTILIGKRCNRHQPIRP